MEKKEIKPTLRRFLNVLFRIPQRTNYTKLQTGVNTVINTFKNKKIIDVYSNIENRFNSKI